MIDTKQFLLAINQIAEEKDIPREKIIETIETAISAAYKKDYGNKNQIIRTKLDPDTGQMEIYQVKIVVDNSMIKTEEDIKREENMTPEEKEKMLAEEKERAENDPNFVKKVKFNEERHIMIDEAKKIKEDVKPGDELVFRLETKDDFGRIAAQTAKQVIMQRLREIERELAYNELHDKEGDVVNAQVQRIERGNVIVDLGRTFGIMHKDEQIASERYTPGQRIKVYVLKVEASPRGPVVLVSRSHPKLIAKLFEMEIPEVASGVVEIKGIAREAGSRSKVAVWTDEEGIDPIGSCVGQKGTRIDTIIAELNNEKIDIIQWSEDPAEFIANALSPAKILSVEIDEENKEASVLVADDQLSLAIGKGGQNVRLAARLTGWKIDVKSESGQTMQEELSENNDKSQSEGLSLDQSLENVKEESKEMESESQENEDK